MDSCAPFLIADMNAVERFVYNLVKRHLLLKGVVRSVYQHLAVLFSASFLRTPSSLFSVTYRPECFFGYYGTSPWSFDDRFCLAHASSAPLRMPCEEESVRVLCFDERDGSAVTVGTTRAWNWQQGAMTQWVADEHRILYNDRIGSLLGARIVDRFSTEQRVLPFPVSALSPDGRYAASYSFTRLQRVAPGYAYAGALTSVDAHACPSDDGLWIFRMDTEASVAMISLLELAAFLPDETMTNAVHYVNHASFSPSGESVAFFHRWCHPHREWTRMVTLHIPTGRLHQFPTDGMVSHFTWMDDAHVLAWARLKERPSDCQVVFTDRTDDYEIIGEDVFFSDGHPSYAPDCRTILTDSYPNRNRMTSMYLYDLQAKRRINLSTLYHPFRYSGDVRVDLHPRWNRSGTRISFDAVVGGVRSLCTLDFESGAAVSPRPWQLQSSYDKMPSFDTSIGR